MTARGWEGLLMGTRLLSDDEHDLKLDRGDGDRALCVQLKATDGCAVHGARDST